MQEKRAFTLVEVLITLGIIGIVAAMTIPTLMREYYRKEVEVKVKKVYVDLTNVIKLSEVDNGPISGWDRTNNGTIETNREFVEKYIIPYYKGIKYCDKTAEAFCSKGGITSTDVRYFINGVMMAFAPRVASDPNISLIRFSVNNPWKTDEMGTYSFYFHIDKNGRVLPYPWAEGLTREQILNNNSSTGISCRRSSMSDDGKVHTSFRHGCTALFYIDGFKFKDDYPWVTTK